MIIRLPAGGGNLSSSGYDDGVLSTPAGRYAGALAPASSLPPPGDLSSRPAFSRNHVLPWVWFRDCRDVVSPVQVRVAVSCPSSRLPRPLDVGGLDVSRESRAWLLVTRTRRCGENERKGVRITRKRGRRGERGTSGASRTTTFNRFVSRLQVACVRACMFISRSALFQVHREFRGGYVLPGGEIDTGSRKGRLGE